MSLTGLQPAVQHAYRLFRYKSKARFPTPQLNRNLPILLFLMLLLITLEFTPYHPMILSGTPQTDHVQNYKHLYNAVEYMIYEVYFIFSTCKSLIFEDMFTKRYFIYKALNFPQFIRRFCFIFNIYQEMDFPSRPFHLKYHRNWEL